MLCGFFFSSRRRHTRWPRDWSSDVCSSDLIQIFDSWVGALNASDYRYFIKPTMQRIFSALQKENVPLILFGVHTRHLRSEERRVETDLRSSRSRNGYNES